MNALKRKYNHMPSKHRNLITAVLVVVVAISLGLLFYVVQTNMEARNELRRYLVTTVAAPTLNINGVLATSTSPTSEKITWHTNQNSDSLVNYGLTSSYGSSVYDPALTKNHLLALTGLTSATVYHYKVTSKTAGGASVSSQDYTFTTQVAVASSGVSTPDTTPPTVSISSPTSGATVSGTITVSASASDNVGVAKVEFYLDGVLKQTDTSSPYTFSWDTTTATNASHTLTAKAYDAAGNTASASVTVAVNNATQTSTSTILFQSDFESGCTASSCTGASAFPGWDGGYSYWSTYLPTNQNAVAHSGSYAYGQHYVTRGNDVILSPGEWMSYIDSVVGDTTTSTTTYWTALTFVSSSGVESWPNWGAYNKHDVQAGNLLAFYGPTQLPGMVGWNVYVGFSSSTMTRQNAEPITTFGQSYIWKAKKSDITSSGPPMFIPDTATYGYAHQDCNRYLVKNFNSTNGYPSGLSHVFVRGYVYITRPSPNLVSIQRKLIRFWYPGGSGTENDFLLGGFASADGKFDPDHDWLTFGYHGKVIWNIAGLTYDTWHLVEVEAQLNTPGQADGVLRVWVDPTSTIPTYASSSIDLVNSGATGGVNSIWFGAQIDRNNYSPDDEYRYWDDIVIGTSFIP
jgi:hypothetical protein